MFPLCKGTLRGRLIPALSVFLLALASSAQGTLETLHSFTQPIPTPKNVNMALTGDTNGYLYGVSYQALRHTNGTIFRLKTNGAEYKVLHEFETAQGAAPSGPLVIGVDGALYGTTFVGGISGSGTLFRMQRSGQGYEVLHHFGEGSDAPRGPANGLTLQPDGKLYGTTLAGGTFNGGVLYSFDPVQSEVVILQHFGAASDGVEPSSPLFAAGDGFFYGTTIGGGEGNGTIFRIRPDGSGYRKVYAFPFENPNTHPQNGKMPIGAIWVSPSGRIYGTTMAGGAWLGTGLFYSVNTDGTAFRRIREIAAGLVSYDESDDTILIYHEEGSSPMGGVTAAGDGFLYLTASAHGNLPGGSVFRFDENGNFYQSVQKFNLPDAGGKSPFAALYRAPDGHLYGATSRGARDDAGQILKIALASGNATYSVVTDVSPARPLDGFEPAVPPLALADGTILGVTPKGGNNGNGAVFRFANDDYSLLHHFGQSTDARTPSGPLLNGGDQFLYGLCESGSADTLNGALYRIRADGSGYLLLRSFASSDGINPKGALFLNTAGELIGTTPRGGPAGQGTLWKSRRDGSGFAHIHDFSGSSTDGGEPVGGAISDESGRLYGLTARGGSAGRGIIYAAAEGSGLEVLYSFGTGFERLVDPQAELLYHDGKLYGAAASDLAGGRGAIFRINRDGSGFEVLRRLTIASEGLEPSGPLLLRQDGFLYGTARAGGSAGGGTIFRLKPSGLEFSTVLSFGQGAQDGAAPLGGVVTGADFRLHGVTTLGGSEGKGSLYAISTGAAITVNQPPANQSLFYGIPFSITLPRDTFAYEKGFEHLIFSAEGLPDGMFFDAEKQIFSGVPSRTGSFNVTIVAADKDQPSIRAETTLAITVAQSQPNVLLPQAQPARVAITSNIPDLRWKLPWDVSWHGASETVEAVIGNAPVTNVVLDFLAAVPVSVEPMILRPGESVTVEARAEQLQTGSLMVEIENISEPGLAAGGWELNGSGEFLLAGATLELPAGKHVVRLKPLTGAAVPQARQVTVLPGQISVLSLRYLSVAADCEPNLAGPVPPEDVFAIDNPPYRLAGQLQSEAGSGSGFAVGRKVVLTAAHLLFEPQSTNPVGTLDWRHIGMVHAGHNPRPLRAKGWHVHPGYAAAVAANSQDAEKYDVAAVWFDEEVAEGSSGGFLVSLSKPSEWLTTARLKMMLGYPIEGIECGVLPGDLHGSIPRNATFETNNAPIYTTRSFFALPGASGGPVLVAGPEGTFQAAAVYLGSGNNGELSRVRVIDRDVADLIMSAIASSTGDTNHGGGGTILPGKPGGPRESLIVRITPPEAKARGAKWRRSTDQAGWYYPGDLAVLTPCDTIEISFSDAEGFRTPATRQVKVVEGQKTIITAQYEPEGAPSLRLELTKPGGLRVSGAIGTRVSLRYRPELDEPWQSLDGATAIISSNSVPVLEWGASRLRPGYYQAVIQP